MSINTSITSRTSQVLVLTVRNVEVSFWITIFLSEAKINHVDLISTFADTHQEIIWLDVTMDK